MIKRTHEQLRCINSIAVGRVKDHSEPGETRYQPASVDEQEGRRIPRADWKHKALAEALANEPDELGWTDLVTGYRCRYQRNPRLRVEADTLKGTE